MKILKIRLHPFAGSADFSRALVDGLNIIEGPNEYGKSTLNNALWHALFTPANLTPAKLRDTMGRWFPKPTGDHARVTLEFEADGQTWTLEKCWGAGASSRLCACKSPLIADPGAVQKRLMELLRLNEATWRHVLFVNQAQLNRTISELREHGKNIDDLQPLLVGASAVPGDIAPEKLLQAFRDRIEDHFSKWDRNSNSPEGGKGIDYRWKRNVGPLLEAYYAMEEARRNEKNVLDHELELDGLNKKISDIKSRIEVDREFVNDGRKRRDGLLARTGQEERIKRLEGEIEILRTVFKDWPGTGNVIDAKKGELERVRKTIVNLDAELKNARKRAESAEARSANGRLEVARDEWKTAKNRLEESKNVPEEQFAELCLLEKEIKNLLINIEANKLSVKISAATATTVRIVRGAEASETLPLNAAESWEGQADGKVIVETPELKMTVVSGTGDVNSLFKQLESANQLRTKTLESIGHESFSSAEAAAVGHRKFSDEEKLKRVAYDAALQGFSEEEWSQKMAALDAIPETRSIEVIEKELRECRKSEFQLGVEINNQQQQVESWIAKYKDTDTLTNKILGITGELNKAKNDLSALPPLPEGFGSIDDYLEQLNNKEAKQAQMEEELNRLKIDIERVKVQGNALSQTLEELSDQLKTLERVFQRLQETGQSLLRIRAKLEQIVAERGNDDPMKGLNNSIAGYFQQMTIGKYQGVRLEGTAPVEVSGYITIGAEQLSQGTLGSLALATRIALADFYLSEMPGFLILDDPFTDMDPGRRLAASECLKNFSVKRQVILFTCHPDHTAGLISN
jgi:DNA repair exonuclease SbcCD ATPase subunit